MATFDPRRYDELTRLIKEKIALHAQDFDVRLPLQVFLDRIHADPELNSWEDERRKLEQKRAEQ